MRFSCKQPDPAVRDSVSEASPSRAFSAQVLGRLWKLEEFDVLNELQKPITIVAPGVFHDADSGSTSSDVQRLQSHVIFQNFDCQRRFGTTRPASASYEFVSSLAAADRKARQDLELAIIRGGKVHCSRTDVYALFRPYFQGIIRDRPDCLIRLDSKPIQVETSPGHVKIALMYVAEMDATIEDLRVMAMHHRSPINSFMFSNKGVLLDANSSALEACHAHTPGGASSQTINFRTLFDMGLYPGGQNEAIAAHEEAMHAVFNLQLKCHRHEQPHRARKDGRTKWAMLEMWPMFDPVDGGVAVLVKRYNITQQKELELRLSERHGDLLRQNEGFQQDALAMQAKQVRLQQEAKALSERLHAVLKDRFIRRVGFDAETPIDKTLNYLQEVIMGNAPSLAQAVELHSILCQSDTKLRQPVALEEQLLGARMGYEVGQSMLQMLQGEPTSSQVHINRAASGAIPPAPWSHNAVSPSGLSDEPPTSTELEPANVVPAALIPEVERMLNVAEKSWQFDIFAFADLTPGHTLSMLFYHLAKQTGLLHALSLDQIKLCNFLRKVEQGYDPNNPYHNSIHVASVVQMTHMLLCHGGIMKSKALDRPMHWGTYWAALVHDYDHKGLNNDFLIKTAHPLAVTYSDQSPLENHHIAAATKVFLEPECQYIRPESMTPEDVRQSRNCAIHQVLGTDMKKHFDILSRFQAAFKRTSTGTPNVRLTLDWDAVKAEDKTLVHQMLLKCADIGHLAADIKTHQRWSYQLEEEFFRQGDKEKELGLPTSPLMDRNQRGGMVRSQLGFFSIVGIPLFKAMTEIFKDAHPMLDGTLANYKHWDVASANALEGS